MNRAAIDRFIAWDRRWVRRINPGCRYRSVRTRFQVDQPAGRRFRSGMCLMLALLCGDPVITTGLFCMALAHDWHDGLPLAEKNKRRDHALCDDQHIVLSICAAGQV